MKLRKLAEELKLAQPFSQTVADMQQAMWDLANVLRDYFDDDRLSSYPLPEINGIWDDKTNAALKMVAGLQEVYNRVLIDEAGARYPKPWPRTKPVTPFINLDKDDDYVDEGIAKTNAETIRQFIKFLERYIEQEKPETISEQEARQKAQELLKQYRNLPKDTSEEQFVGLATEFYNLLKVLPRSGGLHQMIGACLIGAMNTTTDPRKKPKYKAKAKQWLQKAISLGANEQEITKYLKENE